MEIKHIDDGKSLTGEKPPKIMQSTGIYIRKHFMSTL